MPKNQPRPPAARRKDTTPEEKVRWKPGTMLSPVPVVLVTCVGKEGPPNIVTIAWAGTICSDPPMLSISVRPERYSHGLIAETSEFVVNLPSTRQAAIVDFCGVVSGRDTDKFEKTGLTPLPAATVRAPLLRECPVNIECRVRRTHALGSHTLFIAEITAVHVTKSLITPSGRFAAERAKLLAYVHGHYHALGADLGFFGFSIQRRGRRGPMARKHD